MKDFSDLITPGELKYATDHEWVSPAKPHRVGVSDFAQDQLGDLTFVELPRIGASFKAGDEFGSLESIKSVSALYLPVDAVVTAVNDKLQDEPGLVNSDPYGEGWLLEIEPANPVQFDAMMTAAAYLRHVKDNG